MGLNLEYPELHHKTNDWNATMSHTFKVTPAEDPELTEEFEFNVRVHGSSHQLNSVFVKARDLKFWMSFHGNTVFYTKGIEVSVGQCVGVLTDFGSLALPESAALLEKITEENKIDYAKTMGADPRYISTGDTISAKDIYRTTKSALAEYNEFLEFAEQAESEDKKGK